jgi:hypothetical protein
MIAAFLVGGVAGLLGFVATLLLADLGWGMAIGVYFVIGYGVPLAVFAATSLTNPSQANLAQPQMVRR